jgi:hypothetical protein
MKFPKQLFYINNETWHSMDESEVRATAAAMKELGIYKLPYPEVTIRINTDNVVRTLKTDDPRLLHYVRLGYLTERPNDPDYWWTNFGPFGWLQYNRVSLEAPEKIEKNLAFKGHPYFADLQTRGGEWHPGPWEIEMVPMILIVLLATRNAVKETVHNKCAALGIGKRGDRRFEYVTTISLPKHMEEHHESARPGSQKSAHLRRGHVRNQRHGPKLSFVRAQWIEPVFVNADKEWVSQRERYNISL